MCAAMPGCSCEAVGGDACGACVVPRPAPPHVQFLHRLRIMVAMVVHDGILSRTRSPAYPFTHPRCTKVNCNRMHTMSVAAQVPVSPEDSMRIQPDIPLMAYSFSMSS